MSEHGLRLPDQIKACLFDLDGVLTPTATVHAAAWKEMFDEFLQARADGPASRSRRSTRSPTTTSTSTACPATTAPALSCDSRGIDLPEGGAGRPAGRARPSTRSATARTSSCWSQIGRAAWRPTRARCATCRPSGPPACRRAWSPPAPTARDVLAAAGMDRARGPRRRHRRRGAAPARQTGAGHVPRRGAKPGRRPRRRPPCSRTRWPASTPGEAGRFGYVVGVDRVGQADELREHGADVVVADLADLLADRDPAPAFPVEPWRCARRPSSWTCWPSRESVFALSNGHIGLARQPRRGRAARPARHATSTACTRAGRCRTREAGYGYPESGQTVINVTNGKLIRLLVDDEPFDVRYGELRTHERVLDLRAGTLTAQRRLGCAVRPDGPDALHPAGVVHPARGRRDRLRGRARRPAAARGRAVRTGRQRAAAGRQRDPRAAAVLDSPLARRAARGARHPGVLVHQTRRSGCASARAMDHLVDCAGELDVRIGELRRPRPVHRRRAAWSPARPCGWSSSSPTAGRGSGPTRPARPGRRRRWPRPGTTGWDGLVAEQRRYLDDFWARADVEIDGDAGGPAGRPVRAVPRRPGRRPGRAAGRSRPRA